MFWLNYTRILTISILFLFVSKGYSQPVKAFTPDSALFLTELSQFFETTPSSHKNEVKKILDKLKFEWQFGYFREPYRTKVYSTSNRMLQENMKPYPEFYEFLRTILYFYDSRQSPEAYDSLHASFIPLLELTSKKAFQDYLVSLNNFLYRQHL